MELFLLIALMSILLTIAPDLIKRLKVSKLLLGRIKIPAYLEKELSEARNNLDEIRNAPGVGEYNKLIKTMRAEQKLQDAQVKVNGVQSREQIKYQSVDVILSYVIKIILSLMLIVISWRNRSVPVIIIEDNIGLQPFTGLISFPTGVHNAVSVHVWSIVCNVTFRLFYGLVKNRK